MKPRPTLAITPLALLTLATLTVFGQGGPRDCTIQCLARVPTVSVAERYTYLIGDYNWWDCPGIASYIWDFGDGTATSAQQIAWHTCGSPGTYTWTMTVNLEGTVASQTGTIVVDPPTAGCGFGAADLPTGLTLLGNASRAQAAGVTLTPDLADQTGALWCVTRSQVCAGFETTFHFQVDPTQRDVQGGEGFAFVLGYHGLQYTSALGSGGEGMGYKDQWGFAVEFDTAQSASLNDPNGNHIALMTQKPGVGLTANHNESLAAATPPFEIADGAVHTVRIFYDSETLSVYLDGSPDPILSVTVNLAQITSFPSCEAFIGFTAATSSDFESHRILDWNFTPAGPECILTCDAVAPSTANPGVHAYFAGSAGTSNCSGSPAYDWDFGDGTAHSSDKNPVHDYAAAGTFTWTMTVTLEQETCTETDTIEVREPCTLSCTATVPASANAGQAVYFQGEATATNCAGATTYLWAFGDGATSADQNPSHTYPSSGTYTWALTVTAEGETCTRSTTVTISGGILGDCDGDGTVSIGEVQKAINMFLGTQAPDCGVDCSGEGTVSIGEVQKVINAFLGLPASC